MRVKVISGVRFNIMGTFYLQIEQNIGLVCDHFDIHLGNSYVSELKYTDV